MNPLEKDAILHYIKNTQASIEIFETIDSTNAYLKTRAQDQTFQICIAEQQTHGKGRLNRQWHSPHGQNIYLSLSFIFNKDMIHLNGLSLVLSLAIVETLKPYLESLSIKWPNDVMCNNKKLSGSLIEIQTDQKQGIKVVIGVGINVNMLGAADELISQPWTSIQQETGIMLDRNILVAQLIDNVIAFTTIFTQDGFKPFFEMWPGHDFLANHQISFLQNNTMTQGIARGINQQGHLLIEHNNGELVAYSSGDVSLLRKMY